MSYTEKCRREAFESADRKPIRKKITDLLTEKGAMTSTEIMDALGFRNHNSVRPRLTELKADGVIRDIGRRKNKEGFSESVWEIAV